MLLGCASDPIWKRNYNRLVREAEAQGGGSEPEFRLPSTIAGAFLVPIGLFGTYLQTLTFNMHLITIHAGFGWTTYPFVSRDLINRLLQIVLIPDPVGALDRYAFARILKRNYS